MPKCPDCGYDLLEGVDSKETSYNRYHWVQYGKHWDLEYVKNLDSEVEEWLCPRCGTDVSEQVRAFLNGEAA